MSNAGTHYSDHTVIVNVRNVNKIVVMCGSLFRLVNEVTLFGKMRFTENYEIDGNQLIILLSKYAYYNYFENARKIYKIHLCGQA